MFLACLLILGRQVYYDKKEYLFKIMHKQRLLSEKPSFLISGFFSLFLLVGVFVFVMQAQIQQNTRSKAASGNDCTVSSAQIASSAAEQSLFTKINEYRKAQGRSEFAWSADLKKPAAWMSNDLLTHNNLSHTDSLGRDLASRLIDCGVVGIGSFGENIDSGTVNPDEILESWKHAAGQNVNLLNPTFTKAAVSLATDTTTSEAFWVLNLTGIAPTGVPTATPTASLTITPPISPTLANGQTTTLACSPGTVALSDFGQQLNATLTDATGKKISGKTITWTRQNTTVALSPLSTPTDTQGKASTFALVPLNASMTFTTPITAQFAGDATYKAASCIVQASYKPFVPPTVKPSPTKIVTKVPTKPFTPTKTPTPTRIPTPTIDPKFVVNPDDTQIGLSVKIPGVGEGGNRVPRNLSRKIQIDVYDQENELIKSGTGFLIYDNGFFRGIIHLGQLPNNTYYLKVFGPNTLQMTVEPIFQQIRNDRLNILPEVHLLTGDLDTNNILNLEDYAIALTCFQDNKCETQESIDFNDDGKTDVTDYNLLLQNFWRFQGD